MSDKALQSDICVQSRPWLRQNRAYCQLLLFVAFMGERFTGKLFTH